MGFGFSQSLGRRKRGRENTLFTKCCEPLDPFYTQDVGKCTQSNVPSLSLTASSLAIEHELPARGTLLLRLSSKPERFDLAAFAVFRASRRGWFLSFTGKALLRSTIQSRMKYVSIIGPSVSGQALSLVPTRCASPCISLTLWRRYHTRNSLHSY